MTEVLIPTGNEPRLRAPLGGPHVMFDGSFTLEFLELPEGLDASVLMKATYVGGHSQLKLGKQHPQAPPLHIHISQSESFIITSGAIGTTTTYETIDTVHTSNGNYPQTLPSRRPVPPLPSRSSQGVTHIPPYTPHQFWPVGPDDRFWSTPEGKAQQAAASNGRDTDTVMICWAFPRINQEGSGKYDSRYPPDLDAAYFLSILALVDGLAAKRLSMDLSTMGLLLAMQHESEAAVVMAPNWNVLGPLRWWMPWMLFASATMLRSWFGGVPLVQAVEDVIDREIVKRQ